MIGVSHVMSFLRAHLTPEQRRVVKFMVVGASGVPVNLVTVYIATALMPAAAFQGARDQVASLLGMATITPQGLRDIVAYLLGIFVSIFTNFLLNNAWTWGDRAAEAHAGFLGRLGMFYLVSSVAAVVQLGVSAWSSALMRGNDILSLALHGEYRLYHILAPTLGIIAALFINFVVNNLWTFRKKKGGDATGPA